MNLRTIFHVSTLLAGLCGFARLSQRPMEPGMLLDNVIVAGVVGYSMLTLIKPYCK